MKNGKSTHRHSTLFFLQKVCSLVHLFEIQEVDHTPSEQHDEGVVYQQVPKTVQHIAVLHIDGLPRVGHELVQVHLLLAERAGVLLANDAPSPNAPLVETVTTVQHNGLFHGRGIRDHLVERVVANSTNIRGHSP